MSISLPHLEAFSPPVPYNPEPGDAGWRSLRLALPEAAIRLKIRCAPVERAVVELSPPSLSGDAASTTTEFPVTLCPEVAAHLVSAADEGAERALTGLLTRPEVRRLGVALVAAQASGQSVQQLYAQSIGSVIAARVMEQAHTRTTRRPISPLPKWRLTRVLRHVEENLSERLSLAELASKAGLTRMYFATQFRASLGVSPHTYVQRRRIERAQEMLESSNESLVNVALSVGFQTQAHFTTVFKRFVGETPARWRQAHARPTPHASSHRRETVAVAHAY